MRRTAHLQLLATLLNTMANASFTVGIAAPIAAGLFYGGSISPTLIKHSIIIWALPVVILHAAAQGVLRGLR